MIISCVTAITFGFSFFINCHWIVPCTDGLSSSNHMNYMNKTVILYVLHNVIILLHRYTSCITSVCPRAQLIFTKRQLVINVIIYRKTLKKTMGIYIFCSGAIYWKRPYVHLGLGHILLFNWKCTIYNSQSIRCKAVYIFPITNFVIFISIIYLCSPLFLNLRFYLLFIVIGDCSRQA